MCQLELGTPQSVLCTQTSCGFLWFCAAKISFFDKEGNLHLHVDIKIGIQNALKNYTDLENGS